MVDATKAQSSATRSGRMFYLATMTAALTIGALQMYRVRGGFVTDYGADLLGTAWLYAMVRLGHTIVQRGSAVAALMASTTVFALCAASEFGQRVGIVPGRFDPYDIVAFGVAVAASALLDRALGPFAMGGTTPRAR